MKRLLILLFAVAFISCNKGKEIYKNTELNNDFKEFVEKYINEVDSRIIEEEDSCIDTIAVTPFYSLFFFNKNKRSFLTIWASPYYPTCHGVFLDTLKYRNYQYSLEIETKYSNTRFQRYLTVYDYNRNYEFFDTCINNYTLKKKLESLDINLIYDGPYYTRTYEYFKINGHYQFELCNVLFVEPLGSDFIEYERVQQKDALNKFVKAVQEYDNYRDSNPEDTITLNNLKYDAKISKEYLRMTGYSLLP